MSWWLMGALGNRGFLHDPTQQCLACQVTNGVTGVKLVSDHWLLNLSKIELDGHLILISYY